MRRLQKTRAVWILFPVAPMGRQIKELARLAGFVSACEKGVLFRLADGSAFHGSSFRFG